MKRSLLALLPVVAACAGAPDLTSRLTPYRVDVRQGNFLTQEMVAQLKPGQTKDQVRFALGTPLVTDLFHADRWDYVYYFKPGHGEPQQRQITVYFAEGKMTRIVGDVAAIPAAGPKAQAQLIEIAAPVEAAAAAAAAAEKK